MKNLKVYGGLETRQYGEQHRIVVATTSKARLVRILGVGIYIVNTWWAETGNKREVELATKNPHTKIDMGKI